MVKQLFEQVGVKRAVLVSEQLLHATQKFCRLLITQLFFGEKLFEAGDNRRQDFVVDQSSDHHRVRRRWKLWR